MAKYVRVEFDGGKVVTSGNTYDRQEDLERKAQDIVSRHREKFEKFTIKYIDERDMPDET